MLEISIGTVAWSTISFIIVAFLLAKFAWKPILASIKEREDSIDEALQSATRAREEMANLTRSNEELLKQARAERDAMLKDARDTKENIIAEAKQRADVEYARILASAQDAIRQEKASAIAELKAQVAVLSIDIAERVIRQELKSDEKQNQLIDKYLQEAKLN